MATLLRKVCASVVYTCPPVRAFFFVLPSIYSESIGIRGLFQWSSEALPTYSYRAQTCTFLPLKMASLALAILSILLIGQTISSAVSTITPLRKSRSIAALEKRSNDRYHFARQDDQHSSLYQPSICLCHQLLE